MRNIILIVILILSLILNVFLLIKLKLKKNIFAKVSFCLFGEHIFINGLVDSGNSAIDFVTKRPIIFVSFSKLELLVKDFKTKFEENLQVGRFEKCKVAGGTEIFVPIFEVCDCKVVTQTKKSKKQFVIGILNQQFLDEGFDCLVHRDYF